MGGGRLMGVAHSFNSGFKSVIWRIVRRLKRDRETGNFELVGYK